MFEIENVVKTLVEMRSLLNCKDFRETWDKYIHDLIKQEFTFEEVEDYINKNYTACS